MCLRKSRAPKSHLHPPWPCAFWAEQREKQSREAGEKRELRDPAPGRVKMDAPHGSISCGRGPSPALPWLPSPRTPALPTSLHGGEGSGHLFYGPRAAATWRLGRLLCRGGVSAVPSTRAPIARRPFQGLRLWPRSSCRRWG